MTYRYVGYKHILLLQPPQMKLFLNMGVSSSIPIYHRCKKVYPKNKNVKNAAFMKKIKNVKKR